MKSYDKINRLIERTFWARQYGDDDDERQRRQQRICLNNDVLSNVDTAIIIYCVLTQKQAYIIVSLHERGDKFKAIHIDMSHKIAFEQSGGCFFRW